MAAKHRWQEISRKADPTNRTPQKDDVAEFIDELIESGKWPIPLNQVAEQTGYSRSHVSNCLDDYYTKSEQPQSESETLQITVPDDVDRRSFLRGYMAALESRD